MLFVLSTLLLMTISQIAATTSTTSPTDMVIVKMTSNQDIAIESAVTSLLTENPDAKVITYGTFEYYWTTSFYNIVDYVIVGHAAEDKGIKTDDSYLSWSQFGSIINSLDPIEKVSLLNCGSSKILDFVPKSKIGVTFDG